MQLKKLKLINNEITRATEQCGQIQRVRELQNVVQQLKNNTRWLKDFIRDCRLLHVKYQTIM